MNKAETLFREVLSDNTLTIESQAEILAESLKKLGITEKYEGSLAKSLLMSMEIKMELSGADEAIDIVTCRETNWLLKTDSDLYAVLKAVRDSPLLANVRDSSKEAPVVLLKKVKSFIEKYKQ